METDDLPQAASLAPFRCVLSGDKLRRVEKDAGMKIPQAVLRKQPLGDRIILLRTVEPEKTSGGIVRPEQYRKIQAEGWIISVGPEVGFSGVVGMLSGLARIVGTSECDSFLGLFVETGNYVGGVLPIKDTDDEFTSRFIEIREGDIWNVVLDNA